MTPHDKCFIKVKKHVEDSGLNIPEKRLQEFAQVLSQKRADLLTKSAFSSEIKRLISEDLQRYRAKQATADAITLATREQAVQTILSKPYGTTIVENFRAFLEGGSLKAGASVNLDPERIAATVKSDLMSFWKQGIGKFREVAANGALNKEIFQELDAIQRGLPSGESGSHIAVEIAKVVNATQNKIFDLKKSYNPFMEKNQDYLIKRFHNREKVSAVDKEEWVTDAMKAFGEKSFPDLSQEEKVEVFGSIYERIKDGSYGTVPDDSASDKYITVNGAGGNIMKRMARGRQLQVKDWAAAYEYNQKYGYGTIEATVMKVIDSASRDISLLEKFGPNPEAMYEGLFRRVYSKASDSDKIELRNNKRLLDDRFAVATGVQNTPARGQYAKWTQGALTLQYMAKTGGAVLRSLPDTALAAGLVRGFNGKTVFENGAEITSQYLKFFANTTVRDEALESLWMFAKATHHSMMRDFHGVESSPGKLGKLAEVFGKLSLLERHVEAMRAAIGTVVSRELAKVSSVEHSALSDRFKKGLLRYGIGEDEWNVIRQGTQTWGPGELSGDRMKFLNSDGVDQIPDEFIENYLLKQGTESDSITPDLIYLTKKKLSFKLGTLINDHAAMGSTTPGTRQKAFMYGNTDVNSPKGAILRALWQFKSASLTSLDTYRRVNNSGETLNGDWAGVTQMMVMGMFMWTLGEYAKQTLEGKTPEDPTSPKFIAKALVGSGAAGIFGDLLLGEAEREGVMGVKAGILANLAGPLAGTAAEGIGLATQYAKSALGEAKAPNASLARYIQNQTPGQNLFYSRGVLNFYFMNSLQEFLDPGYLGHLEGKARENNQEYFMLRPMETPRW